MTAPLTGFQNASTPGDLLLDSGILRLGANIFAALRGGIRFDPGVTIRNVDFDGKRAPIRGLDRRTMVVPKISGTMIELPFSRIAAIEPGSTAAAGGGYGGADAYTIQPSGILLASGSYQTDVRAIWRRGNGELWGVRFPVALCTRWTMSGADNEEGAIEFEFEARLDLGAGGATTATAPYVIDDLGAP